MENFTVNQPQPSPPAPSSEPPVNKTRIQLKLLFVLIVIASVFSSAIYFLTNQGSKTATAPSPTIIPQLTTTPKTTQKKEITYIPLPYNFYTERFLDEIPYPSEMTSLVRNDLKDVRCSERLYMDIYENPNGGEPDIHMYSDTAELFVGSIPKEVLREAAKRNIGDMLLCDTQEMYIAIYVFVGGAGGSRNIAYVYTFNKESLKPTYVSEVPREGSYFGCSTIHVLTKNNELYLECGGGDVGYSSSVYKIDIVHKVRTRLLNCYSDFVEKETFDVCVDTNGKELYRKKWATNP